MTTTLSKNDLRPHHGSPSRRLQRVAESQAGSRIKKVRWANSEWEIHFMDGQAAQIFEHGAGEVWMDLFPGASMTGGEAISLF